MEQDESDELVYICTIDSVCSVVAFQNVGLKLSCATKKGADGFKIKLDQAIVFFCLAAPNFLDIFFLETQEFDFVSPLVS